MKSFIPYFLLAIAAGFCLPTQAGINAQLNLWTRSPVLSAAVSFGVGTAALILYAVLLRTELPALSTLGERPWWIWTGGFLGAFLVAATVILAPRLGAAPMLSLIIAGQMLASLLLDHFGLLGFPHQPASPLRLTGILLIIGGVLLVRHF